MGAIKRLKQLVGSQTSTEYECRGCGMAFTVRHYTCPECGSYSVERPPESVAD